MNDVVEGLRHGVNIRDAIIFLIDWRKQMTEPNNHLKLPKRPPSSTNTHHDHDADLKPSMLSFCLRTVAEVMRAKIRDRNKDAVSVIAFGATGPPTTEQRPGIRVIRKLRESDANGIKKFQQLARRLEEEREDEYNEEDEEDEDFLFADYDEHSPFEFEKALWAVRHEFSDFDSSKKNITQRKKVFIFTTDDNPCKDSNAIRQMCMTHARDLADMNAFLDITLLTTKEDIDKAAENLPNETAGFIETFNEKFVENLPDDKVFFEPLINCNLDISLRLDDYDDGESESKEIQPTGTVSIVGASDFEEMSERIKRKEATKRAIRVTHLTLAPGYKIGIALYALVRKARRPTNIELVADTNNELVKMTAKTCPRTAVNLKSSDIRHSFNPPFVVEEEKRIQAVQGAPDDDESDKPDEESGGEHEKGDQKDQKVSVLHGFKREELVKAKAIGREGLVMYGFRPKEYLKKEWCLGPPTFVFPDESKYIGSTKVFAALNKNMMQKGVIAIVSVRRSDTSAGNGFRFGTLVAQAEKFVQANEGTEPTQEQVRPGGMHLHILPYKDDMYHMWRKELTSIEDEDKEREEKHKDVTDVKKEEGVETHEDKPASDEDVEMKEDAAEENGAENGEENEEAEIKHDVKEERLTDEDLIYGLQTDSVTAARKMIRKLNLEHGDKKFEHKTFANPDLQRFYHSLELAAGIDSTPNPEDEHLIPDVPKMKKRAGVHMENVMRLEAGEFFDADVAVEHFGTKSGQRAKETLQRRMAREEEKEQKRLEAREMVDIDGLEQKCEDGVLEELKVKELKMYCRAEGLKEAGVKRNLVISIEEHVRKKRRREERKERKETEEEQR